MSAYDELTPDEKWDLARKVRMWEKVKAGPQTACPECGAVPECFHASACSQAIIVCSRCRQDTRSHTHRIECLGIDG